MSIAELFKKKGVLLPVIASVLFGTFTGVKYVVNLTDTINANQTQIPSIQLMAICKSSKSIKSLQMDISARIKTKIRESRSYMGNG